MHLLLQSKVYSVNQTYQLENVNALLFDFLLYLLFSRFILSQHSNRIIRTQIPNYTWTVRSFQHPRNAVQSYFTLNSEHNNEDDANTF